MAKGMEDIPEGFVELDKVRDEIKDSLTTTMRDEKWSSYQEEWYNAASIKKYNSAMDI